MKAKKVHEALSRGDDWRKTMGVGVITEDDVLYWLENSIATDFQFNPEDEHYCGYLNLGRDMFAPGSEEQKTFLAFVEMYDENTGFDYPIRQALRNLGLDVENVGVDETIFYEFMGGPKTIMDKLGLEFQTSS